jgi:hypothetical protein
MFLKNHCKIITLKIANQDTVQFLGKNVDHFSHRREFDYEISNFGGCERLLLYDISKKYCRRGRRELCMAYYLVFGGKYML